VSNTKPILFLQGGNTEELIDLTGLSRGAYTVNLKADSKILSSKKLNIIK